jgi:flagellar biosynthesis protein FlhA
MKLVDVQQVLQHLLREEISIRPLTLILEALGEAAGRLHDPVLLAEFVRARLARAISARYRDKENRLLVVTLDPVVEEMIRTGVEYHAGSWSVLLPPDSIADLCRRIGDATQPLIGAQRVPVVLVSPQTRAALAHLIAGRLPRLVVLSYQEITRDTRVESVAMVDGDFAWQENAAAA